MKKLTIFDNTSIKSIQNKILIILLTAVLAACGAEIIVTVDLKVGQLTFQDVSETTFTAIVPFEKDQNNNSSGYIRYCNDSDYPECDPEKHGSSSMMPMEKVGKKFIANVTGLSSPNDPGEKLNVVAIFSDAEGVNGGKASFSVRGSVVIESANASLRFINTIPESTAGSYLTPAPEVEVIDRNGQRVSTANNKIRLLLKDPNNLGGKVIGSISITAENGVAKFPAVYIDKSGNDYQLQAQEDLETPTLNSAFSNTFSVVPASISKFIVTGYTDDTPVTAGTLLSVTVEAQDATGNTVTDYSGEVEFYSENSEKDPINLSSFPNENLEPFVSGENGDKGVKQFFNVGSLMTTGLQDISVREKGVPLNKAKKGSLSITVLPSVLKSFKISGPSYNHVQAATYFSINVTAIDEFGNIKTDYNETVKFSILDEFGIQGDSNDGTVPSDYKYISIDKGEHQFSNLLLNNANEDWTVKVMDSIHAENKGVLTLVVDNGPPVKEKSIIVADVASSTAGQWANITITLIDQSDSGARGYTPTCTATVVGVTDTTVQCKDCSTTGSDGISKCKIYSEKAGIKKLAIVSPFEDTYSGLYTNGSNITYMASLPDSAYSSIIWSNGPTSIRAGNGAKENEKTYANIILKDRFQNYVNNLTEGDVIFSGTGTDNTFHGPCVFQTNGLYNGCYLTSTKKQIQKLKISAPISVNTVESVDSITFIGGDVSLANSYIVGGSPVTANGITKGDITIYLFDAYNNTTTAEKSLTFSATPTDGVTKYPCVDSGTIGRYDCQIASTKAEVKSIKGNYDGADFTSANGSITFNAGTANKDKSTITQVISTTVKVDDTNTVDNAAIAQIKIELRDTNNNPIIGEANNIVFTASGTNNSYRTCAADATPGDYICSMTSTKAENKQLVLEGPFINVGDKTFGDTITFVHNDVSNSKIVLANTNSGPYFANGSSQALVGFTIQDKFSNPIKKSDLGVTPITLSATSLGTGSVTCNETPASSGIISCAITSTVYGNKTIQLTSPVIVPTTLTIPFVADTVPSDSKSKFISTNYSPTEFTADGIDEATIEIQLRDANDNPISGWANSLKGSLTSDNPTGLIINSCSEPTIGDYSCGLRSSKAENKNIKLSTPNISTAANVFTFVPGTSKKLVVVSGDGDHQSITAGTCSSAVTIKVTDSNGNFRAMDGGNKTLILDGQDGGKTTFYADGANCSSNTPLGSNQLIFSDGATTASFVFKRHEVSGVSVPINILVSDNGGILSSVTVAETINAGAPNKLVLLDTSWPSSLALGVCSDKIFVNIKDASDNNVPSVGTTTINLSSGTAGISFYDELDSSCSTIDSSFTIANGINSGAFRIKLTDFTPQTKTITVDDTGVLSADSNNTVDAQYNAPAKIVMDANKSQTITAGNCSSEIKFTFEDSSGYPAKLTSALSFALSATDVSFYLSSDDCTNGINPQATINLVIDSLSGSFWVKRTNNTNLATTTLGVTNAILTADNSGSLNFTSAAASKIVIKSVNNDTSAPYDTITKDICAPVIVGIEDSFGNPASLGIPLEIDVTGNDGESSFYTAAGCNPANQIDNVVTNFTINNSSTQNTFWYKYTGATSATKTITLDDTGAWNAINFNIDIGPGAPYKIVITSGNNQNGSGSGIVANDCSADVIISLQDISGIVTTDTLNDIEIQSSNTNFKFFDGSNCSGAELTSIKIAKSNSTKTFSFKNKISGNRTDTLSSSSHPALSFPNQLQYLIKATIPNEIKISSSSYNNLKSSVCAKVDLAFFDEYGNSALNDEDANNVTLSSDGDVFQFFSNNDCNIPIASNKIDLAIGDMIKSLYFKSTTIGSASLKAEITDGVRTWNTKEYSQVQTIIANDPEKIYVALENEGTNLKANDCRKFTITMRDKDNHNVQVTNPAGESISFNNEFLYYLSSNDCLNGINAKSTITIANGQITKDGYLKRTATGVGNKVATFTPNNFPTNFVNKTINIVAGNPTQFSIVLNATQTKAADVCSDTVTMNLKDASNNDSQAPSGFALSFDTTGTTKLKYFLNNAGSCGAEITAPKDITGLSTFSFHFKGEKVGTYIGTITSSPTATITTNISATIIPGVASSFIITDILGTNLENSSVELGQCSNAIRIQVQDDFGNNTNVDALVTVNLTGSNVLFFEDDQCNGSAVIDIDISAGTEYKDFYVKKADSVAETITINAETADPWSDSIDVTFTNPPATLLETKIGLGSFASGTNGTTISTTAGSCSGSSQKIIIGTFNSLGLQTNVTENKIITMTGSGVKFFSDSTCNTEITSKQITIANGSNESTPIYVLRTTTGAPILQFSVPGLTSAKINYNITAAPPAKLFYTTGAAQDIYLNGCSTIPIRFISQDSFNNLASNTSGSAIDINLTSTITASFHPVNAGGNCDCLTEEVTKTTLPNNDYYSEKFCIKPTTPGNAAIVTGTLVGGTTPASSLFNYLETRLTILNLKVHHIDHTQMIAEVSFNGDENSNGKVLFNICDYTSDNACTPTGSFEMNRDDGEKTYWYKYKAGMQKGSQYKVTLTTADSDNSSEDSETTIIKVSNPTIHYRSIGDTTDYKVLVQNPTNNMQIVDDNGNKKMVFQNNVDDSIATGDIVYYDRSDDGDNTPDTYVVLVQKIDNKHYYVTDTNGATTGVNPRTTTSTDYSIITSKLFSGIDLCIPDGNNTQNITFSAALDSRVGVGDAVFYDINNLDNDDGLFQTQIDSVMYITSISSDRKNATAQKADGSNPTEIYDTDTNEIQKRCDGAVRIYRAYSKLNDAQNGKDYINQFIPYFTLRKSDKMEIHSGTRDLRPNGSTAGGEIWKFALNGTGLDTSAASVTFANWITERGNYIKIFATGNARHNGSWGTGGNRLKGLANTGAAALDIQTNYFWLDGVRFYAGYGANKLHAITYRGNGTLWLTNNIFYGYTNLVYSDIAINLENVGTLTGDTGMSEVYIFNNVINYFDKGIYWNDNKRIDGAIYNNTIVNVGYGIDFGTYETNNLKNMYMKNNLVYKINGDGGNSLVMSYRCSNSSCSDLGGVERNVSSDSYSPNDNVLYINQTVTTNATKYWLDTADTSSKNKGLNLSTDIMSNEAFDASGITFNFDAGNQTGSQNRGVSGDIWDIGADESGY